MVLDKLHERWGVSIDYLLYGIEAKEDDTTEVFDEEFDLNKFIEKYGKGGE